MLSYLKVSDFALVSSVEVEFHGGLNVLSGETGAGKTVLIGAIGLLLGDRAEAQMVRTGATEAVFEASFDISGEPAVFAALKEMGYLQDGDDELTLGRRLPREGKSRCTVNGRLCPVSTLAAIGDLILEVHGQNTHQALLMKSSHIGYLDRYAGAAHLERLRTYTRAYERLRALLLERKEIAGGADATREAQLLSHEVEEIEAAAPVAGEIDDIEAQASRLRHSRELWELASGVEGTLCADSQSSASVRDLLARAVEDIGRMASRDESLRALAGRLESLSLEAEDVAGEVGRYREGLDTDPGRLDQVESRLSALRELCRKYGGSLDAVIEYRDSASARLEEIGGIAERARAIEEQVAEAGKEAAAAARKLASERRRAASSLEKDVMEQMAGLELTGAGFGVKVDEKEPTARPEPGTGNLGPTGCDEVEFFFRPEPDEPLRPLRSIASGGEMSRVMLAVKIVLAEADRLPVLVFDEVDAGIGGEAAATVGEKLYELTSYHQVFCVTHLPQIASFADWQYRVFKTRGDGSAHTGIALLDDEDRVAEMCRMLGDSSGRKVTAEHARDILKRAEKRKKSSRRGGCPSQVDRGPM